MFGRSGFRRPGRRRKAALEVQAAGATWRERNPLAPLAQDATVVFAMPLIARERAQDWSAVQDNLAATLRSVRAQSSHRWEVVICGQDLPECVEFDDRVRFLHHPERPDPDQMTDRPAKLDQLIGHFADDWRRDGYFFMLDADDLVHPDLVSHCVETADRSGYILPEGFMLDASGGTIAYMGESRIRYPKSARFYNHCGSCTAIRMDFRKGAAFAEPLRTRGTHKTQVHNLAAYGIALKKVPFGGVIYVVNHGQNLRERRGKMDTKIRYLERNRMNERAATKVREAFGLPDVLANG